MQFSADTELAAALARPMVKIRPQLYFDWYRDGSFAAPPGQADMTDLTKIMKTVDIDGSSVVGDLPTDVNVITGARSGQMTVVLAGRRRGDSFSAQQMFSKYFVLNNPLAGFRKEGTPVVYNRIVRKASGDITIRQFTGWIKEAPSIDEESGEVTLICTDNYDLAGAVATVPRWAIGPGAEQAYPAVAGQHSRMHTINTDWVYSHLLQQGGRSIGPTPKVDTVAYFSCNGSFLPSIGTLVDARVQGHWISYESAFGPWTDGIYGLTPYPGTGNNNANLNQCTARAPIQCQIPPSGLAGAPPKWSEHSIWAYSDGTGDTSQVTATSLRLWLDSTDAPWQDIRGRTTIQVNRSGRIQAFVSETVGLNRVWSWFYDVSQPLGWHYYSVIVAYTNSGITATIRVDDSVVTPTATNSPGAGLGYRYSVPLKDVEVGNQIGINAKSTVQHAQIRFSSTAITYDPAQKGAKLRESARMAVFDRATTQLVYLPDTINVSVWETLKKVASAEMGVLYIDEFGVCQFRNRENVWNIANINLAAATAMSRDKMQGLKLNQAVNLYRNAVSFQTSFTQQIRNNAVWSGSDPLQFYAPDSAAYQQFFTLGTDVISIVPGFTSIPPTQTDQSTRRLDAVQVAAVRADTPSVAAPGGWAANTIPVADQRSIKILWSAQSVGFPLYIGAFIDANQAAYFVPGTKYDSVKHGQFLYTDDNEINLTAGIQLLEVPQNDWMQSEDATDVLSSQLLRDLTVPAPVFQPISVPADPRRQLLDVVTIPGGPTILGTIKAQLVGIHRHDTPSDCTDEYTLRVLRTPSQALWDDPSVGWNIGTWDA